MIALAMHYTLLLKHLSEWGTCYACQQNESNPHLWMNFQLLLKGIIPENRRKFDWYHEDHDSDKKYTVDCRINGLPEPIFVYALFNNDRIRDATIALQRFNVWNIPHRPLGIFENKEDANRKVQARFDDVCQVQFPNMRVDRDEIIDYISKQI